MMELFGYDLHFLPRVVRGDGDSVCGLLREAKLQRGAGEPIDPVEFYVQGVLALPTVGTCHVPGGGKVAEVALERRVVVGQGIELGFYPLAVAKGDGIFVPIGIAYVK